MGGGRQMVLKEKAYTEEWHWTASEPRLPLPPQCPRLELRQIFFS